MFGLIRFNLILISPVNPTKADRSRLVYSARAGSIEISSSLRCAHKMLVVVSARVYFWSARENVDAKHCYVQCGGGGGAHDVSLVRDLDICFSPSALGTAARRRLNYKLKHRDDKSEYISMLRARAARFTSEWKGAINRYIT